MDSLDSGLRQELTEQAHRLGYVDAHHRAIFSSLS